MKVLGHTVQGYDQGQTAIVCLDPFAKFRLSWDRHERCTAIYIAELELVKVIMKKGKHMGPTDFFIGGDFDVKFQGLVDSLD